MYCAHLNYCMSYSWASIKMLIKWTAFALNNLLCCKFSINSKIQRSVNQTDQCWNARYLQFICWTLYLFTYSRHSSIETKEEIWKATSTNRWNTINNRNAERSTRGSEHKYSRFNQYEKCCRRTQSSSSTHVRFFFVFVDDDNSFDSMQLSMTNVFIVVNWFDYNRDVDQVHDMMDDIAEQQDVAREISDAISNPVAFGMIVTWFFLIRFFFFRWFLL